MNVQWSSDLEVGVELIDSQHKELFVRFNNLLDALWEAKPKEEVSKFLDFLGLYVHEHFGAEEDLMQSHDYPLASTHKAQHMSFVEDFGKLRQELETKQMSTEATINLINGTYGWLRNHIKGTDQLLGEFLKDKM